MEECLLYSLSRYNNTTKKLGRRFSPQFWINGLIKFALIFHTEEWRHFYSEIHQPSKKKKGISKQALIDLAYKYYKLSYSLLNSKQTWFVKQITSLGK